MRRLLYHQHGARDAGELCSGMEHIDCLHAVRQHTAACVEASPPPNAPEPETSRVLPRNGPHRWGAPDAYRFAMAATPKTPPDTSPYLNELRKQAAAPMYKARMPATSQASTFMARMTRQSHACAMDRNATAESKTTTPTCRLNSNKTSSIADSIRRTLKAVERPPSAPREHTTR